MAYTLVGHVSGASTDAMNATTAAMTTTGSTLFVAIGSITGEFQGTVFIEDFVGGVATNNGWVPYGGISNPNAPSAGSKRILAWACLNPGVVGANHTFKITSTTSVSWPSVAVVAYSGVTSPSFDTLVAHATSTGSGVSDTTGTLTPAANNEVLIAGLSVDNNDNDVIGSATVTASYSIIEAVGSGTNNSGLVFAHQIQTSATARNPTWTVVNQNFLADLHLAFGATSPSTGTLVVTNATTPSGSPQTFTFTASGGLSPTSFTLTDGQSQTFNNVTAGSGYGIVETGLTGWTTTYTVSNASPNTNLVITAGQVTTVSVANVANTPTITTRAIRRERVGPHMVNELLWLFHTRFQIDIEVGVGNSDQPNPSVNLLWSDDGGYTWNGPLTATAGVAGAYDTRVLWYQLGRSRDRVYRVYMTDPNKWALVEGYAQVEQGIS